MAAQQLPKHNFTCYYWQKKTCKYAASECKFLHYETERIANPPPKSATKRGLNHPSGENEDLLCFSQNEIVQAKHEGKEKITLRQALDSPISTDIINQAVLAGQNYHQIKDILRNNPRHAVKESLTARDDRFPVIFTVIEHDRADLVKLIIEHGADPNTIAQSPAIPALASAILGNNTSATRIVHDLLCLGADPFFIPQELWEGSVNNSTEDKIYSGLTSQKTSWCTDAQRELLKKSLNVSMKHSLLEASKIVPSPLESLGLALPVKFNALKCNLIGQKVAIHRTIEYLTTHAMTNNKEPLVMMFAGPVGHGKSSLAQSMGTFIPIELLSKIEESSGPFEGADEPDNYFQTGDEGLKIVFIDESKGVDLPRLLSFLDGAQQYGYYEQGIQKAIKPSKSICIISTIEGQQSVIKFHNHYLSDSARAEAHWDLLEEYLKECMYKRYGASLASRINCIVPFLPFTRFDLIALAHKFLSNATVSLSEFHDSTNGARDSHSKVQFTLNADADTCSYLAVNYDMKFGARSIKQAIFEKVQTEMVKKYLESDLHVALCHDSANNSDRRVNVVVRKIPEHHDVSVTLE